MTGLCIPVRSRVMAMVRAAFGFFLKLAFKFAGLAYLYAKMAFNLALLHKWRWRFYSSPDSLWVNVIKALHGNGGGFDSTCCNFNGNWSKIVGTSNYLHSSLILPLDSIRFQVGCGSRTRFWKDIWLGNTPLSTRFNRLFRLEQDKNCLIVDRISNGQWSWNWSSSTLGIRNTAFLNNLLAEISLLDISVDANKCTWSLANDGLFKVGDLRRLIDDHALPTLPTKTTWDKVLPRKVNIFIWRLKLDKLPHRLNLSSRGIEIPEISCPICNAHSTTWDKSIPRKVNVFMWRLSLDRLPHRLNLSSRGMDIPAISCPSCNANVESANHVFFECDIATDMWKLVFRWCDIPLFQASSWDSFNDWIISWHASKEKKHRFYVITTSVLWWLWRYRNSVTFSSQPLRKSDLFDNVRFSSFSWLHNRDHMKLSWNDWLMTRNEIGVHVRTLLEIRLDDPPMAKLGNHDDPLGSSSGMGARGIIGEAFVVGPAEVGADGSVEDFWLKITKKEDYRSQ
ncbi:RNA-directed DNA polymerase, eukaryota, reverse transcriptase zinc-binding domain protein [Tanacetum coccineum]